MSSSWLLMPTLCVQKSTVRKMISCKKKSSTNGNCTGSIEIVLSNCSILHSHLSSVLWAWSTSCISSLGEMDSYILTLLQQRNISLATFNSWLVTKRSSSSSTAFYSFSNFSLSSSTSGRPTHITRPKSLSKISSRQRNKKMSKSLNSLSINRKFARNSSVWWHHCFSLSESFYS